jgi:hypothetical protein
MNILYDGEIKVFEAYRLMRVLAREVPFHHAKEKGIIAALQALRG